MSNTDNMSEQKEFHVIIIGAGITGLVLAQALKQVSAFFPHSILGMEGVNEYSNDTDENVKSGISYSIYEKEAQLNYRSNEWTMAIHWSLDHLQKLLPAELFAKLPVVSCNPAVPIDAGGNYPIIHAESGNLLAGVPYARGLRVPRSKMRALCAEGIDVQYGMNLTNVEFDGSGSALTAIFNDSTQVRGSLVLGSDGPRSSVRNFAIGNETEASTSKFPIFHTNMTVCYGDADKARYLRQAFPTSYLALSENSYHAFQSSECSQSEKLCCELTSAFSFEHA